MLCALRERRMNFPQLSKGSLNKLNKPRLLVTRLQLQFLFFRDRFSETGSFESRNWRLTVTIIKPVLKQNKTKNLSSHGAQLSSPSTLFSATEDALDGLRWLVELAQAISHSSPYSCGQVSFLSTSIRWQISPIAMSVIKQSPCSKCGNETSVSLLAPSSFLGITTQGQ